MISLITFFVFFILAITEPFRTEQQNITLGKTRRILNGREVGETRPYMVYLRPASSATPLITDTNWLCGGVIIHERFVLTSAACIEDAKQFYVVSGTHKWVPVEDKENLCVKNGAKKAVWKCVPSNYFFDGNNFDNIRWMMNDIAVVKVEDDFNFKRRVKGCDFIPKKIAINNESAELEKTGTIGSIAGWGSTDSYSDTLKTTTSENSPVLLEADVMIISKKHCKQQWDPRYHYIIEESMICAKDGTNTDSMGSVCADDELHCKDLVYSDEEVEEEEENKGRIRRFMVNPDNLQIHSAAHSNFFNDSRRQNTKLISGGFCENDHGGPLVVGQGKSAVVIGVISACMTKEQTHKCYGPFLFTSVWRNKNIINCVTDKKMGSTCRRLLSSTKTRIKETIYNWSDHPDGDLEPWYGKICAEMQTWQFQI